MYYSPTKRFYAWLFVAFFMFFILELNIYISYKNDKQEHSSELIQKVKYHYKESINSAFTKDKIFFYENLNSFEIQKTLKQASQESDNARLDSYKNLLFNLTSASFESSEKHYCIESIRFYSSDGAELLELNKPNKKYAPLNKHTLNSYEQKEFFIYGEDAFHFVRKVYFQGSLAGYIEIVNCLKSILNLKEGEINISLVPKMVDISLNEGCLASDDGGAVCLISGDSSTDVKKALLIEATLYESDFDEIYEEFMKHSLYAIFFLIGVMILIYKDEIDKYRLEKNMSLQNRFLQTILDNITSPIFVKDDKLRYVLANKATAKVLGFENESYLIGRSEKELNIPKYLLERFNTQDKEVFRSQKELIIESEEIPDAARNETRWFKTIKTIVKKECEDRCEMLLLGVSTDITKNEKLKQELSVLNTELNLRVLEEIDKRYKSEERFRELFDNINDAILLVTYDEYLESFIFVEANKGACNLFKKERVDILYTLPENLLKPIEEGMSLLEIIDKEENVQLELKIDVLGEPLDIELKTYRYLSNNQLHFIITVSDISEKLRLKYERKDQKKLLETIFKNAKAGICFLDREGRFVRLNKGFAHMTGYHRSGDLKGESFLKVIPITEAQKFLREHKLSFEENQRFQVEYDLLGKDGDTISVFGSSVMIKNEDQKQYRLLILEDITKLKELENRQKEQERMMAQQAKMAEMGDMIGAIAHQWRQPLNTINAAIIKLRIASELESLTKELLVDTSIFIEDQTTKMSGTINDFLNFFKPSKDAEYFSLEAVLQNILKMIGAQLEHRNIEFEYRIDDALEIFGYKNELEHVLLNIILNARDALEDSAISHKFIHLHAIEQEDEIVITIEDSAGGIPESIIKKIFNPYFTTKDTDKGTGIGLYMSKTIVERSFGGSISVSNTLNGAQFTITVKRSANA